MADNSDNHSIIFQNKGKTATSVTLTGRTLYKDGKWNTLCLPFAVSTTSGPLSGDNVQAMTLNTTTSSFSEGTLTLNFAAASGPIPAGTPFIIKWDESGSDLTASDLVFNDVTISSTTNNAIVDDVVSFVGTYSPMTFVETVKSILFLGGDNTLYYPQPDTTTDPGNPVYPVIGAQRAYFQLNGITAGEASNDIRAFVLNFDGRRMSAKPTAKGLYIYKGRKTIIK
ncbi:MAG: hypothetical protein II864_09280 [Prevotella sp.]|nr:hypothetical protein [Prevotella sp.]MBR0048118.1 hypothetical protein [Prevotella sp.]